MNLVIPHRLLVLVLVLGLSLCGNSWAENSSEPETTRLWSMADSYWGTQQMTEARREVLAASGGVKNFMVMADRLEVQFPDGDEVFLWDAQGWYGSDINKLFIKSEGEYSFDTNKFEDAEVQALWSRAVAPFWDLQLGVRYDFEPEGLSYAVLGIQGLAPYWFEVDTAAFISSDGDLTGRIEAEYELLLTQRLVLQPRVEVELSAQDIPELNKGSGLTTVDAGIRLRYAVRREFAPYIGVEWQGAFGDTKDYVELSGDDANQTVFVAGVRVWF